MTIQDYIKEINVQYRTGNAREQFNRYRQSLDHIIFTDYLDFHLYENGEWIKNVRLAEIHGDKICLNVNAISDFESLVAHIADTRPQPITSASRLAQQMAAKARMLAETIKTSTLIPTLPKKFRI